MRAPRSSRFLILAALLLGFVPSPARAQAPGGFSDFFVLGQDEHVWNMMNRVRSGEGAAAFPTPNRLNSVSSATATADGQRITYDHWEDGLEADITAPVQTSTLVFGDSNNANGRVCDYSVDPRVFPCTGVATHDDVLYAGTPMSLASDQGLTGPCAAPYAAPPSLAQIRCSFPISPVVASITQAAGVATVTVTDPTGHSFANGSTVRVAGANETAYNGSFTIATAGPASLTFTYAVPPATPSPATGTITVSFPTIRFDGGDRVFSTGGALPIAQIQDPGTPLIGGGTELLARELVKNATSYSVPVGEDLYPGANNAYFSVKYEAIDVVAFDDNTNVTVTSPGGTGGVRSFVLHRGQHYTSCATFGPGVAGNGAGSAPGACLSGAIDGPPPPGGPDNRGVFPALALTINAGTKIATDGPLNALIFTGGAGAYQTRHYATLPDILHTTDYVTTAPGDSAAGPVAPGTPATSSLNLFIYNPNPTTSINVTTTDTLGTTVITIPANSVADYRNSVGRFVPADSGVRLQSTRPFWGLSSYDSLATARDWGHAWLGVRFLKNDYTVAYSPGTQATPVDTFSLTAGCVATITTGTSHFLGQLGNNSIVRVSGVSNAQFNGVFTLTNAAVANAISYNIPGCTGAPIAATVSSGTVVGVCDTTAVPTCNSYNRDPIWVAGTQNNTQVKIDLDADGLWDFVDINSDNCPDNGDLAAPAGTCENNVTSVPAGCAALTANQCVYVVNAPGSASRNVLRVWDYTDQTNAGTRIVGSAPIALSWGEDTDQGQGADPSPDNGYTVYPPIGIDLVLGIEKTVSPLRVPLAGGAANYTVRIFAGDYGPLTFVLPRDTLPVGITCANYQSGSTVITYPNLTTSTADPVCAVLPSGRSQLTWAPVNTTLFTSEQMLITYTVNIPAAPGGLPRTLENEAQVTGNLGGSVFNPKDTAILTQADLTITKSVTDDGVPEVGDVLTYTVAVTNGNVSAETNVVLTDIIPPFTTYVPGSATISTSLVKTVTSITKPANPATTATVTFANPQGALDRLTVSGATGGTIAYNGTFTPANLALTGIAFAGATATATTATAHGWANGDIIQIAGATDPLYNGRFTIAAVTATTFQYTMSGTPGAPSPAGPTATQRSTNKFSYTVPAATPSPATGVITASGAGFDAGQNAVVWSGDTFAALAVATVTFQVRITDSTPTGSIIANTANYSSTQIRSQNSNTVQTTVIGPILGLAKAIPSVRSVSVTSLSDGGTSTATATSAAHGFTVGQFVTIAGATATAPNNYNGTFLVATVPNANTFTYTESAASGSAAGGVITATTAVTPGSVLDYEVLLSNGGTGGAKAVGISDNLAGTNTTYMPGSASFSVNGGPFTALSDAADVDRFFFSGTTLNFSYFRPVTSITRAGATATVTTSVPHFFANGNSVTIAGADDPAYNGTFVIAGVTATTFTYTVVGTPATPATGVLTAELNPTFSLPPGGTIRLRFKARVDPGTVGLYATNQAKAVATGQPITPSNLTQVPIVRPTVVSIAKTSSGAGIVLPGQTLTYTIVVANDTGTTQTGITINDPLPAGTTYVPGSASVTTALPVFRSTEYYVAPGVFTLATFQLTLNQALATNYFVITQGSDLNGGADAPPSRTYISLTGDPFGTGTGGAVAGLANTGVANRIDFTRGAASLAGSSWSGVITVVECLTACTTAGFQLRDVARIAHPLATVGPTAVLSDFQWTGLGQMMLLGGFQGAGCDTAEAQAQDTKGCHVRLFPSGVSPAANINWTRDGGGAASLTASTSTVMVLEWGTQWTVNRQNITGGNGGAGIDAVAEYDNSAAFAAVARAKTWVWGTGHTNNNEQQNASEGVALTLGNGVVQNANETILSAGIFNAQTKSFEVYALTHPSLVVDHRFKPQNTASDPTTATFDQTTSLGSGSRMALSYMGVDMNDNAYPQSMFSARYLSPAQIRLERRRTGGSFAAWTQGINFSNLSSTTGPVAPGHLPPGLVIPADGFTIPPGGTLTLTYQVLVDSPLSGAIAQIANTATYTSAQILAPGISSTAIDTVARPAVKVEPNNAGFVPFNAGTAQTILFTQGVTNLGTTADSFTLTLRNDILGWKLELIDPATGTVIATDSNGDGVWDGGVIISTGSLSVNQTKSYTIRATVPAATPIGTQSSVELTATSALVPTVKDVGTDEITVLDVTKFGPVVLLPDHSGIVTAGQSIAYTHRIFNNTGSPEIFDLVVAGTGVGWTRTVHVDTNGDGVYTAGIDIAVTNTANLPNGGSQILFVVVTAPLGATPGQNDLTDLTARSQTVPTQVDSVTDTTTILSATSHDLTGGGTRMVALGDTATFPGTLYNLTATPDRFDIKIAAASLFGVDGLNHPSVLRVDTNADGISDTTIAVDTNGDGVWDSLCGSGAPPLPCSAATFNSDGDAFPDVLVAGNGALNYELVRVIDPAQAIWKEYVTLSATSFSTNETDAVTAQWIIAALSRASIRGLRVDLSGVVEFVTGIQRGTKSFNLFATNERSREGERTLLNASPILSPGPDSAVPILYRVETDPIKGRYLLIEETETSGAVLTYGPYSMNNTRLRRGLENVEAQMDAADVPAGPVRLAHHNAARSSRARAFVAQRRTAARSASALARVARRSSSALRLDIEGAGVVSVPMADLVSAGLPSPPPRSLSLTNLGRPVPFRIETRSRASSLVFTATPLETDYSEANPYVLSWGATVFRQEVWLTRSSDPARPGYTRVERNSGYALAFVPNADPWVWDTLTGDGSTWPYAGWDPTAGRFDLPQLTEGSRGTAPVLIRLVGLTENEHAVTARINGIDVGSVNFTGVRTALLSGSVPLSVLHRSGNELTLTYSSLHHDGSLAPGGYVLLDYLDIAAPMSGPTTEPASLAGIEAYSPTLPSLSRTQYLIVTHPLFKGQADRLAALKEDDGLRATVVTTDTAYDRFSGGVPEPQAIAALIRKASENRRLRYVLLFGDDTFDPRNFLGGDKTSFVPSIMGREGWGRIPNENAYADTNGDGRPDLAIGRLPVSTALEAATVVDKIAQQMTTLQASGNVHVFVNDDSREIDSRFDEEAAKMSFELPASSKVVMADVGHGVGLARQALFGSWGAGVTMTHYFGHGGPEIWTDEALLSVDDALPETMSPMILFAWACQSQWYQNYFGPTINEALFLAPRSGSLASFGPVGTTSPAHQRAIYERVYQDLYAEGLSLGEIIRRAKTAAVAANPSNQDAVDGFMFFGDPSLHIPRP